MTRVDEFDSFYRSTSASTLAAVYAISGDRSIAHEATVDAYRRAWRDWSKIRDRHPAEYVRGEAHKLVVINRSTHPLRRRHEDDSDTELLDALAALPSDERRLIVLMTLGSTDLEAASREIGVPAEVGIEAVTNAITALEARLGQDIGQLETRINGLTDITRTLELPAASVIRRKAVRGRRLNTVALVAASITLILGGGFLVSEGDALASRADLPDRQKLGAEQRDVVLDAAKIDADNLLTRAQVSQLDPEREWAVTGTDKNASNDMPYATCPTKRYATKNPLKVFVRTYETTDGGYERVAQAIEVARTTQAATDAYQRLVRWYADCAHPRVQLVETYTVERPFGDFKILRLVSHREPERTFTVGFSHSGSVTSTVVHEVEGDTVPSIETFAQTLNQSVQRICVDSGGRCSEEIQVRRANPPRTSKAPAFLGIVDLPPIARIDQVWAGVDTGAAITNPAATLCDAVTFDGDDVDAVSSRVFVIPGTSSLPEEFGVAQTVARFDDSKAAKAFVDVVAKRIRDCPDESLPAKIDQTSDFDGDDVYSGRVWRIGFEVDQDEFVYYRTAVIQRGAAVSQVTFTPSGNYDVSAEQFQDLAERAAQRLAYLK